MLTLRATTLSDRVNQDPLKHAYTCMQRASKGPRSRLTLLGISEMVVSDDPARSSGTGARPPRHDLGTGGSIQLNGELNVRSTRLFTLVPTLPSWRSANNVSPVPRLVANEMILSPTTMSFAVLALCLASLVSGAANLTPNYEVKLLMPPSAVLGSDFKLTPTVLDTFGMPSTVTKMNVQFLDTDAKDIYNAGWSPRIRSMEGQDDFDLTYKKRYPITGDDIDGALTLANAQGFDATDDNYEAQVEWGFSKKTLSLSNNKVGSGKGFSGMDLPGKKDSIAMLNDKIPGKMDDWAGKNWGSDLLDDSRLYGPVLAKRSIGTFNGIKFYIEVWPIQDQYVVEASFKVDTEAEATQNSADLKTFLASKGWLLEEDSLKTQLIMDSY